MVDRVLTASRAQIAGRLLRASDRGVLSTTPYPVTFTNGAQGTINSPLTGIGYNAGKDLKTSATQVGGGAPLTGTKAARRHNGGYIFGFDGDMFELFVAGGQVEMYVNDGQGFRPAVGSPFTFAAAGYKRFDFGSVALREVEFRFIAPGPDLYGLFCRPIYSVWPITQTVPKVPVIGDSLTAAVAYGDVTNPGEGYAMRLGRNNNWETVNLGVGGNGYVAESGGTGGFLTQADGLSDHTDASMVVIAGGYNDASFTSTLQAAVTATINKVRSIVPNALIAVMGPWRATSDQTVTTPIIKAGYDAAADSRMFFVNNNSEGWFYGSDTGIPNNAGAGPMSGDLTLTAAPSAATSATLTTPWVGRTRTDYSVVFDNGSGNAAVVKANVTITNGSTAISWSGAVTASGTTAFASAASGGNTRIYLPNDTIHWGKLGHAFIERRLSASLRAWLKSMT